MHAITPPPSPLPGALLRETTRAPDLTDDRQALEEAPQILTVDLSAQPSLSTRVRCGEQGIWIRLATPIASGTPVVAHLLLPGRFPPLTAVGHLVSRRPGEGGGSPWILIWFRREDRQAIRALHLVRQLVAPSLS